MIKQFKMAATFAAWSAATLVSVSVIVLWVTFWMEVAATVCAAPPTRQFPVEATTDDKQTADLERLGSRANELVEQVDAYGLAQVETEDQLREELRKVRDELAALRSEMEGIRDDHAKLWILMHSPPIAENEKNPVKEFMEAKRPEVYGFSPWFACPHCVTAKAYDWSKGPFDVHWGEVDGAEQMKAEKMPANAGFPLFKVPTKKGDVWLWGFTPEQLIAEFERRNK